MRIHDKNKFENSYKVWPSRPQHQIILCCSYIITLITSILEFLMNWFNVNPQKSQITWIHNFCLDWFNISLQMSLFHNHVKQIPGADSLAHCPPCEERWDGPPDLTWELVSICIHDNKQLYHTHTHFKFNTIFQPICHHCTNTNFEYFFYKCDKVFIKTYFLYIYFYKVFRETLRPEHWQFFHWGSIDWMNSCNLASHFRSGLGATQVRPPQPSLGFRERH